MRKRIGIFGSAFNPPTYGHKDGIEQSLEFFDEVWLLPSYSHAFGKKMLDFEKRCELLKLFISDFNLSLSQKIKICKEEKEFKESLGKDVVYTYDILVYLKNKYKENDFVFICGEDNSDPEIWSKFYKSNDIDKEFGKYTVKERVKIRSTYIRNNIENNKEIKGLTTPKIEKYLIKNKIYK